MLSGCSIHFDPLPSICNHFLYQGSIKINASFAGVSGVGNSGFRRPGRSTLVQRRNFAEALHESAGTPGPVARVTHAAIIHHEASRAELREIMQEAGQLEVPKLERFLGVLATLAYLAPLLGLLGTVSGMIDAFGTLSSNGGYATVTELSNGVYKSLLTTAAGLVVATPTFVAYSYLSSRVNSLMHEMERAGIEVVHMLTDREPMSDIITFQAPVEEKGR